ncbi:hypothetical protein BGW80DRAFT_1365878, partial [Lactifluus volemus]
MQLMFIQAHGSLAFTMESERSPIPTFTRAEKHHKRWTPFPIFAVLTTLPAPLFVTTSFDEDSEVPQMPSHLTYLELRMHESLIGSARLGKVNYQLSPSTRSINI